MPRLLVLAAALFAMAATGPTFARSEPLDPPRTIEIAHAYEPLVVDWPEDPSAGPKFYPDSAQTPEFPNNPNMGILGNAVAAGIGAAIASVQVANGEERAAKLRSLLDGYGFNARFDKALRAKLAVAGLAVPAEVVSLHADADARSSLDVSRGLPLFILPRHRVLLTFEQMSVIAATARAERSLKANGELRQKLREERIYAWHFPLRKVEGSFATADSERWASLGAERLAALLDEGIDEVTDMIVHDLTAAGRAEALTHVKAGERKSLWVGGMKRYGRLIEPAPGRAWLRKDDRLEGFHEVDERVPAAADTPR
jgi:hypothetical protein